LDTASAPQDINWSMEDAVNATTDNFSTLIMETVSHGVELLSNGI
jgi:hypothetical protein